MKPSPTAKKLKRIGRKIPPRISTTVCAIATRKQTVETMRRYRSTSARIVEPLAPLEKKLLFGQTEQQYMRPQVSTIAAACLLLIPLSTAVPCRRRRVLERHFLRVWFSRRAENYFSLLTEICGMAKSKKGEFDGKTDTQ